jgi:hypothetical protein
MEPFMTVADMFSRDSLHGLANSALPDAPVQPFTEPRHRMRRMAAYLRRQAGRPTVRIRRGGYAAECSSP